MEATVALYPTYIKSLLTEFEQFGTEWSQVKTVFDDEQMRYIVMRTGWMGSQRVHRCLLHIEIQEDLVVIQANNTESLIDEQLIGLGIPAEKIRLGFLPPAAQKDAIQAIQEHFQLA